MTLVYKVVAFWENIPTGFSFILLGISAIRATEIP
jgi:hypothetical protein